MINGRLFYRINLARNSYRTSVIYRLASIDAKKFIIRVSLANQFLIASVRTIDYLQTLPIYRFTACVHVSTNKNACHLISLHSQLFFFARVNYSILHYIKILLKIKIIKLLIHNYILLYRIKKKKKKNFWPILYKS